jgi:hypothetical protein
MCEHASSIKSIALSGKHLSVMNFSDITEAHWAYKYVAKCVEKEYMLSYPDGTFKPDKDMTRAEAAALIYRVLKGEEKI